MSIVYLFITLYQIFQGGAQIADIGATMRVIIGPSDDAFGVFQFAAESREVSVQEESDSGYTNVVLKVRAIFEIESEKDI